MARRGNGEGNIKKRTDGRWEARVSVGYQDGRALRKSIYGKTRSEVQRQMAKAMVDLDKGIGPTDDRQTVRTFLEEWLEVSAKSRVRWSTYTSYEGHIRLHLIPELGRTRLSKLTPRDVQAFMNKKVEGGLSPLTVRNIRATLRAALADAVKWGVLSRNVAALADPPRVPHQEMDALTVEESMVFLEALRGHRLEALYSVGLALGLRRGEALGLRWDEDIDLEQGTISISHSLQRQTGKGLVLGETKSATSRRTLPLPAFAAKALKEHRIRQLEERMLAGSSWKDTGFVFTSTIGTPLDPDKVSRGFKTIIRGANLAEMPLKSLRHTCASLLAAQGVPPRVAMEILGHSDISLTMNTYSHVFPDLQRDAIALIDDALAGVATGS